MKLVKRREAFNHDNRIRTKLSWWKPSQKNPKEREICKKTYSR